MTRVAAALLLSACTGTSVTSTQGIGEPIVVESAQFLSGTLPGVVPPDAAPATTSDAGADASPVVTDISVANAVIVQGEQGLVASGHATPSAETVGVRFGDLGSGYWVVPVGAPDPSDDNLLTWQLTADFARNLPPGFHDLLFAAIGTGGTSGVEDELTVCVDTPVPDNLNICDPTRKPPAAVLSLSWDAPVDLEISVETPSGSTIGGSHATTGDGGVSSGATIDHLSNQNCVIDNIDREDVVWSATPETGSYQVWVNLVRACQQPAVTFSVSLWLPETQSDGTERLVEQTPPLANGELLAIQATGGTAEGLFVGSFLLE